jgi:hypothetical protein
MPDSLPALPLSMAGAAAPEPADRPGRCWLHACPVARACAVPDAVCRQLFEQLASPHDAPLGGAALAALAALLGDGDDPVLGAPRGAPPQGARACACREGAPGGPRRGPAGLNPADVQH